MNSHVRYHISRGAVLLALAALALLALPVESQAQLSGTYTIGSGGTYATFGAAVAALNTQGVSGPVIFDVTTGSYTEQIAIKKFTGSSSTNKVTFKSHTNNAADVTLSYTGTNTHNYVVDIDSASYVTFQNMTFTAGGNSSYSDVFYLDGTSSNITIQNNVINGVAGASGYSNSASIAAVSSPVSAITITGNTFTNNAYNIYLVGTNLTSAMTGTQIRNNTLNNPVQWAIYLAYQDAPVITGNTISNANAGIEMDYTKNGIQILKNKVTVTGGAHGIYLYSGNGGNGFPNPPGLIANNSISDAGNGGFVGIYFYSCTNFNVYYNSVNMTGGSTTSSAFYSYGGSGSSINVENNIFANPGGGYAMAVYTPAAIGTSDYNDLYSNGCYLANWNNTNIVDIEALRSTGGKEASSISYNPNYTSATNLKTGSPWLNGKATPLADVTDDQEGNPRNGSTPDPGAYEYTPNPAITTPLAGHYTIGSSGTYTTFRAAVNDMLVKGISAPVTFDVQNGTYTDHILITDVPGATASNTVTFQGGSAALVIFQFIAAAPESNYVVKLDGAHHLRFRKMTVRSNGAAGAAYGRVFDLRGGFNDLVIDSTIILGTPNINASGLHQLINAPDGVISTSLKINGNTFTNGSYGIAIIGISGTALATNTEVTNNTFNLQGADAIWLQYHDSPLISGNTISNPASDGIYVTYCPNNLRILKNKITMSGGTTGITLYSCAGGNGFPNLPGLLANNVISMSSYSGVYGMEIYSCTNQNIYYNSVNILSTGGNSTGLYLYGGSGNSVNVENNIFASPGGGYAMSIYTSAALGTSDYNDLYTTGNYIGTWNSTNVIDLEAYRSISGKEASSISYNPNYTSATNLKTGSPWLNGKATPLADVTDDMDGNARNGSNPDPGAYEYTPNPAITTPLAGHYTIGSSGNYTTFRAAVNDMLVKGISAPVTFDVQNGTYADHILITDVPGATASNIVTFQGGNAAQVTLYFLAAAPESNYVVKLDGAHHLRFRKMTVRSNGAAGAAYGRILDLRGGFDDVEIDSTTITGTPGVASSGNHQLIYSPDGAITTNLKITRNTFTNGSAGIYVTGVSGTALCTNTQVTDNTFNQQGGDAIWLQYHDAPLVSGNTITSPGGNGIELTSCPNNIQVLLNKITTNSSASGIYFAYCAGGSGFPKMPGLVANNLVIHSYPSSVFGIYFYGCTNQNVYYNSINMTGAVPYSAAFYLYAGSGNSINVENNIFANPGGGYTIFVYTPAALGTSDYNDLYTTGNYIGYWANTPIIDLAAYRAVSGKEASSVPYNPNFISAANLHTGSPWLNARATPLADVSTDIDGNARDASNPDIGAYEYTPDPSITTPLAGHYTIGSGGNYTTFKAAMNDLLVKGISAPVTFDVLGGTYNEHILITDVPGATASNTVTFQGTNTAGTTLYYVASAADSNYVIRLVGGKHLSFRKLTLRSNNSVGASYGCIFDLVRGVEDITIDSTVMNGTPNSGGSGNHILINGTYGLLYRQFRISGNTMTYGSYAIDVQGLGGTAPDSGLLVVNNKLNNQDYIGIYLQSQASPVVSGNSITNASSGGIQLSSCTGGILVTKNKLALPGGSSGIYLYSCVGGNGFIVSKGLVANNFIQLGYAGSPSGIYPYYCQNINIYHNSVNLTGATASSSCLFFYGGSGNNSVNNIFANPGGGYAVYVQQAGIVDTANYNDLYTTGSNLGYWNGNVADLPALRSASGKEANSISTNPGFFSATNLHTLSPALDSAATPLASVSDDIDGNARSTFKPDIGASEFSMIVTFVEPVYTAWNMVSIPLTITDARKIVLFPTAISNAFTFGPSGYIAHDTMRNGTGYWMKFPSPASVPMTGAPRVLDTIQVRQGWNLIGAIGYPIPKGSVAQNPLAIVVSSYFSYSPTTGYQSSDTVKPGLAYWVKVNNNGTLILDVRYTQAAPAQNPKQSAPLDLASFSEISIGKAGTVGARLFFTSLPKDDAELDQFALPPAPPDDAFDVRFASGRSVEVVNDQEMPILIHGDGAPLSLSWTLKEAADRRYVLVEKTGGKVTAEYSMQRPGSATIDGSGKKSYTLKVEQVPVAYALSQNYPNPFNPTTKIQFALAAPSKVTLQVYNILGQVVATPLDQQVMEQGIHTLDVDARDWVTGVYFYRITAGSFTDVKKMVLVR